MIARMTARTASRQTSRNPAEAGPHSEHEPHGDKARQMPEAIIEDAGETDDSGRDLARAEGGTIDLPTKPGDLSNDD